MYIYNIQGQNVKSIEVPDFNQRTYLKVNLEDFEPGVYFVKSLLKRKPLQISLSIEIIMINRIKTIAKLLLPKYQKLILEYPVELKPRFGYGKSPHSLISDILESQRPSYEKLISEIIGFQSVFSTFKDSAREKDENQPAWNNGYLPGLDIVTLYAMISHFKPVHYFEIGSGNSTKVARKSISNNGLKTKIISIDPQPRANIDVLADEVIREPLENLNSINQ
jgi:hypothetical protein